MIYFYYADFSSMDLEKLIREYSGRVDGERFKKAMCKGADLPKARSLIAGYLLQVGIRKLWREDPLFRFSHQGDSFDTAAVLPLRYRYTEQGKPYLTDVPGLYFNLSHSGNVAACAVADCEVGMDVQVYEKGRETIAGRFFTKKEQELLQKAGKEGRWEEAFFALWSIKESYLKYTGLGMKKGLASFDIDFGGQAIIDLSEKSERAGKAYFRQISLPNLPEYAVSVCCGCKEMEISVHQIPV